MIDDLWYKHAVIYSLDVGTFMDSNGDGIGDFEGLSRRLDYLEGLGVSGCSHSIPRRIVTMVTTPRSLSKKEREIVYERFVPDPSMQLYGRGIRRRLAPMLGDHRHIEMAYSLLFSLPGTLVLRYGDEVGMGDDLSLKERAPVRTPMQWSNEPQAGFSAAKKTTPFSTGRCV